LARGGSNAIDNILPACSACNQRKHLLTEAEFRARLARERGDAA
jgi:5-methylcytosine-specific restriction endonuclease McrA